MFYCQRYSRDFLLKNTEFIYQDEYTFLMSFLYILVLRNKIARASTLLHMQHSKNSLPFFHVEVLVAEVLLLPAWTIVLKMQMNDWLPSFDFSLVSNRLFFLDNSASGWFLSFFFFKQGSHCTLHSAWDHFNKKKVYNCLFRTGRKNISLHELKVRNPLSPSNYMYLVISSQKAKSLISWTALTAAGGWRTFVALQYITKSIPKKALLPWM